MDDLPVVTHAPGLRQVLRQVLPGYHQCSLKAQWLLSQLTVNAASPVFLSSKKWAPLRPRVGSKMPSRRQGPVYQKLQTSCASPKVKGKISLYYILNIITLIISPNKVILSFGIAFKSPRANAQGINISISHYRSPYEADTRRIPLLAKLNSVHLQLPQT